jgi:hypothetical protein
VPHATNFRLISRLVLASLLPAAARGQVVLHSSTVEEHTSSPGDRYTGSIVLTNTGSQARTVRIYQTDYSFAANGTSDFADPGTMTRSNARWIALQSTMAVVPANADAVVPYTVAVPQSDSLKGTYWSIIMVEEMPLRADPQTPMTSGPAAVQLTSIIRYGIQVATHIEAGGTRTVHFSDAKVENSAGGIAALDVVVSNAGERGYRPTLWVEVYDAEGAVRAKVKQARGLIYPGSSFHQRFNLGVLPKGTYKAVIFADSGSDTFFAQQFRITI